MTLQINSKIPSFSLKTDTNSIYTQEEFLKYKLNVLYFYPKDNTPGCTNEAIDFNNYLEKFNNLNVNVVGCSKDSVDSHVKFKNKYNLNFTLLSDPDLVLHNIFGAYGEVVKFGKKSIGVKRSTFIIDNNLTLIFSYPKVIVKDHVSKVLEKVRSIIQ